MTNVSIASDLYRQHEFYKTLASETRQLGRAPVDFVRMHQPPFEAVDPQSDFVCFAVDLAPGFGDFEVDYGDGLKTFNATPKDFGYVNPTEAATLYRTRDDADMLFVSAPVSKIARALEFDDDRLRGDLRPLYSKVIDNRWYLTQALSLWHLARSEGAFSALAVEQGFLALIARLLFEADEAAANMALTAQSVGHEDLRIIRVCEFIEDNLARVLTLSDLAEVACLSSYHFCRVFKATTGHSPRAYISERRVAKAKLLLTTTQAQMTDIALDCGFSSSQHFASSFRKHTGMTPGEYRREATT